MTSEPGLRLGPSRRAVVALANPGLLAGLIPMASAQAGEPGANERPARAVASTLSDQPQPSRDPQMSAYAIFIRERTRNPDEMKAYADRVTPILSSLDATVLAAYGPLQVLEGPAPEGVVIVKFPSMEAARAFYDGPAYQAAVRHRFLGADFRALLVQGLD
jgi:uncharacterized protein (DUF1330 family)